VQPLKSATIKRRIRLLLVLVIVWPVLAWSAAKALIVSSAPSRADAIVVLAGSSTYVERTQRAAELFQQNFAPKVILTNDNQQSGWSAELQKNPLYVERAAMALESLGVGEDKIEIVPQNVSSTRDEATSLRDYAIANHLHSIVVVTSAYQTRRARWTFDQIFSETGIIVSFAAVPPGQQTPGPLTWWLHRRGWRMVAGEYVKFAYYFVRGVQFTRTASAAITSGEETSPQNSSGFKTDRRVYRKPPLLHLPRAGGKFIDPVFGTEIMRATDESDGPAPGLGTYYSHWPTFNLDNTRLLIRKGETGDAILKTFDPVNFRIGASREVLPTEYPRGWGIVWESSIWSHRDPEIIYTFANDPKGGMRLYAYNVGRKEFKLLKDFSFLSRGRPDYLHQMNLSADDDVFSWSHMRTGNNGDPIAYLVWRRSTDKVLFDTPNTMDFNEVHVDKTGHWLNIPLNKPLPDSDAMEFLNLDTGGITKIVRGAPDYKPGHGDLGTDCIVGFDAWLDGITWRRLSAPHVVRHVFFFRTAIGRDGGVTDWTHDFHGTMLADNEDWITIATYRDPSVNLPGTGIFDDEVLQVSLDGSERIRRICHTRCFIDNKTTTTGYWATPKPTISRDGRFIAFTSNWENSGRYDLFVARIEPAPYLTTTPAASPIEPGQRQRRVRP
jgi:uncharacterized SAM-binding protein YcdF (DUF218 family)